MKWILESVLKSRLAYRALVWWERINLNSSKMKLNGIRVLTLRTMTGAVRCAATAALGLVKGVKLFHITVKMMASELRKVK